MSKNTGYYTKERIVLSIRIKLYSCHYEKEKKLLLLQDKKTLLRERNRGKKFFFFNYVDQRLLQKGKKNSKEKFSLLSETNSHYCKIKSCRIYNNQIIIIFGPKQQPENNHKNTRPCGSCWFFVPCDPVSNLFFTVG